ncbi:hypothetical protein BC940DRAFT_177097 [Gongronella butleri]|nr:hypothetical protein BC940DRAFT_177097 [Gongronella butleri]
MLLRVSLQQFFCLTCSFGHFFSSFLQAAGHGQSNCAFGRLVCASCAAAFALYPRWRPKRPLRRRAKAAHDAIIAPATTHVVDACSPAAPHQPLVL